MIRPGFLSNSERKQLTAYTRNQCEAHGVARRANAILLLDDGENCVQIAKFLYLDDDTIRNWYKCYRQNGLEELFVNGWKGSQSRMTSAQEADLCTWLDGRFCRSTVEIQEYITSQYGLEYSHSGCVKLLGRLEYVYRKPRALPKVPSVEKQNEFIEKYDRLMNELQADEAVYFADAVHPEYQAKPAFGWVKAGSNPAVRTTTGRKRMNIHAALDLETFHTPFVAPETVNGVSSVKLLAKIEADNPDKRIIHVIWDNAAYHKGTEVKAFLARKNCRIHLVQLPPYCPHLNPIERLWGVMHRTITHNRHYSTERQFVDALMGFFRKTIPTEWERFRDQVSDNFRIIDPGKFRVLA